MNELEGGPQAPRRRIAGIDLARAVAIIGMLMVHLGPTDLASAAGRVYALAHGRASVLFVLLAGVGVSLLASSRTTTLRAARLKLAWRAALLLPAGLVLQALDHNVLVILQTFALLFLLGIFTLQLSAKWLLSSSMVVFVLGPSVFLAGETLAPATFDRAAVSLADPISEIVHALILSGPYPLITWAAPFLFGMYLGRRNLYAGPVRLRWLLGGAVVATLTPQGAAWLVSTLPPSGWAALASAVPHNQMPFWLLGATGSAVMVFALCLLVADALGRVVWPLVVMGQLALTVYVGHLVALDGRRGILTSTELDEAVLFVLLFVGVAILFSVLWRALFARGPLEAVLNLPWWLRHQQGQRQTDTVRDRTDPG